MENESRKFLSYLYAPRCIGYIGYIMVASHGLIEVMFKLTSYPTICNDIFPYMFIVSTPSSYLSMIINNDKFSFTCMLSESVQLI